MTTTTPAPTATTFLPHADHRTTLHADACQWFVAGVRRQARVAREAGVSLADASAALAWQEAHDRDRHHWDTVDTISEATGTYHDSTRSKVTHTAGVHPVGDGSQPWEALHALAYAGTYTIGVPAPDGFAVDGRGRTTPRVLWSHTVLERISRRGRRVRSASVDGTNAAKARAALQVASRPMTQAERAAVSRRRRAEEAARAAGTPVATIEAERAAWLAKRAARDTGDSARVLAEALAVASSSWDTDA